jgi:3-hydroxy-9,10-secoandrosta-1,3,5(10)-triene-9,17-dione monooxygenase
MVQGALEEFLASLKDKHGPGRTADSVALQLRIAESSAEVDTARLIVQQGCREMLELGAAEGGYDAPAQAKSRRDFSFAARMCLQSVDRLFEAAGGRALREDNPLQRHFRDAHAASHHIALYWDAVAEGYGRAVLGLPPLGRVAG